MQLARMDLRVQQAYAELEQAGRTLREMQQVYGHSRPAGTSEPGSPALPQSRTRENVPDADASPFPSTSQQGSSDLHAKLQVLYASLAGAAERLHPSGQGADEGSDTDSLASTMLPTRPSRHASNYLSRR
jgi:hypothetical protein